MFCSSWAAPPLPEPPALPLPPLQAGLRSSWDGRKGAALEAAAQRSASNYLTLHYQGHGTGSAASSGTVDNVHTMEEWIEEVLAVLDVAAAAAPAASSKLVLVGSSLGAWLALHVALQRPECVSGLVLIAPAVDASRRWAEATAVGSAVLIPSSFVPGGAIHLRRELVDDANSHFLLLEGEGLQGLAAGMRGCHVHILHGDGDDVVPTADAQRLAAALPGATLEILEGGDHRLSRAEDLNRLEEAVRRALEGGN